MQAVSCNWFAHLIVAGTLWCGVDDIAEDYHSLGPEWQLDKCCRAHDHCPVKVKSFRTRYKVFNLGPYTKSHCLCDKLFYDCLKKVNSEKSDMVGDLFFNIIGVKCIDRRKRRRCVLPKSSNFTEKEKRSLNIGLLLNFRNAKQKSDNCLQWNYEETNIFQIVDPKIRYKKNNK